MGGTLHQIRIQRAFANARAPSAPIPTDAREPWLGARSRREGRPMRLREVFVRSALASLTAGALSMVGGAQAFAPPTPEVVPSAPGTVPAERPQCENLITLDTCCAEWIASQETEVCCPGSPRPDGIDWCCPWVIHDSIWRAVRPCTRGWVPGTEFPVDFEAPCRWWVPLCGWDPGDCDYDDFPSDEQFCESVRTPLGGAPCGDLVGSAG